jgi:hypothetical protein
MMIQILFIFCAMFNYRAPLKNKVDPRCYEKDYVRAWVYFTDKGITTENYSNALDAVQATMNRASFERRALRKGVIDYADIPLDQEYVDEVEACGGLLIRQSKWLNAASFWIAREDLDATASLDFIFKITPVASFRGPGETELVQQDTTVFGISYQQLNMFNIDELHDKGIFGSNVKVGILDTGLRRKHIALNNIKVTAEHDFLSGDQIFLENTPITEQYGVCSDIEFHGTTSRLNIFVTRDTVVNFLPVRDVLYTYSTDGGTYWEPMENITNNSYGQWARELDVCGRDTMFVLYRDRFGIKYKIYTDTIIGSGSLTSSSYREPSAVQIDDTVYVFYHGKTSLSLVKGTTSGFGSGVVIDSSVTNIKNPESIMGTGKVGAFYYTYPHDSIFFLVSSIPASATTFTKNFRWMGKDIETAAFGDTIFCIWKDASNEPLSKIAYARSTDFGTSFTSPLYLSDNINAIGKISVAKLSNAVTVAWETEGTIYSRTSYDNGVTFATLDSLNKEFTYLPTLGTTSADIVTFYCERGDTNTDGYASTDPDHFHPRHGTEMLGLIGGYLTGHYIGVAPGVQFLVAKTENPDSVYEFPVEEDTWVTGLEWLESRGADIVNSSLGYTEGYIWQDSTGDYDGKTSPASIAAYEATRRGVIVVNSVGNVSIPQVVIPADAEGVITVGGIDTLFTRWVYSGYGPTNDNRMKPEIVCLSTAPVVVNPDSTSSYLYSVGTSGASAMVSGICALLLEGHPSWTVDSVRDALFSTASFASSPTDSIGYGWPDAVAAFEYSPPEVDTLIGNVFLTPFPNPFILSHHTQIVLPFKLSQSASVELRVFSITGRLVKKIERAGMLLPGRYTDADQQSPNAAFVWDGTDEDDNEVGSGVYYCLLITHGAGNSLVKIAVVR